MTKTSSKSFGSNLFSSVATALFGSNETEDKAEQTAAQVTEQATEQASNPLSVVTDIVTAIALDKAAKAASVLPMELQAGWECPVCKTWHDGDKDTVLGTAGATALALLQGSELNSATDEQEQSAETVLDTNTMGTYAGTLYPFDDESVCSSYIRQVLRHFEGNTTTPCVLTIGQSSATISTGLDLGQHDANSLRAMGISEDIITLFEPLLGQDATSAQAILENTSICLTDEQNEAVEKALMAYYTATTATLYNKALEALNIENAADSNTTGNDVPTSWSTEDAFVPSSFAMLPKEMQAVIVSVLYQHGSPQAVPRFWSFACNGQWQDLVAELRNFYSSATVLNARREEEADLILLGMGRMLQSRTM